MFFILSKILSFLISPTIIVLSLLIISLLTKVPSKRKRFLMMAIGLFLLFSNPIIINQLLKVWELKAATTDPKSYDAVIVLGGFMSIDKTNNSYSFGEGADRLTEGLILYKRGSIKKIILSGGSGSLVDDTRESVLAKAFLVNNCGVPDSAILIDTASRNTYENAVESKKIMEAGNLKTAVMITSAWHMRRALGCFEKVGLNVAIHPTDHLYIESPQFSYDSFIPSTYNIIKWETLMHEIAGIIMYKIRGYN
jgi:uncharacterized SAM-binding protein YcdF (DUF218 family)